MLRGEFVVDTIEEYKKLKAFLLSTPFTVNIDNIDVFCIETNRTHFFTIRELDENLYTYYEEY